MKIGIVGLGVVGKQAKELFERRYTVAVYDPKKGFTDKEAINKCDMVVICVPTPENVNGSCNTKIVEESISWITAPLVLIKSTVSPGTTDRLARKYRKCIVFSPEYVGESRYYIPPDKAFNRMIETPFWVLGGNNKDCNKVLDILIPVTGASKSYHKCSALEAELIKYMENTYFAVKITFAQEMYRICETFGADWYNVWEGWALDPRVEKMHTAVFPKDIGFDGKCLPKDTAALVYAAKNEGFNPLMLSAMIKSNQEVRGKYAKKAK